MEKIFFEAGDFGLVNKHGLRASQKLRFSPIGHQSRTAQVHFQKEGNVGGQTYEKKIVASSVYGK